MIKTLFIHTILSLSIMILGIYIYDLYLKSDKKEELFYVIDIEKLYGAKQNGLKHLIESDASEKEIEAYNKEYISYVKRTEAYLSKLSSKNNIVIFNKKAIFSKTHTIDLSERIINEIK